MAAFADLTPTMVGGAADLSESTKTAFPGSPLSDPGTPHGRNVKFGVREHGMGGIVNGMAAHGGILCPYGSTFLQFADYMRPAVRLSALSDLKLAWIFTHDSVGLGEDGPTHQPVEHFASLRAIPELTFIRPGDAWETAWAWQTILERIHGPAALALSRQDLPVLDATRERGRDGVPRGAYVLEEGQGGEPELILVGTGSEVSLCVSARDVLQRDGIATRVVSMPSWELFAEQDDTYRATILPAGVPKLSVEAGVAMGWEKWVDAEVSIERFGASAPGAEVLAALGISVDNVVARAKGLLEGRS
jgi:transketolase